MSITALKYRSRLALHRKMSRPASFYPEPSSAPETVDVRTFYEGKRVGDLKGTNLSYAEQLEHPTELIFWDEDLSQPVARRSMVVFTATEGYFIDVTNPNDTYTTKAEVSPMSVADLQGKILPDGTTIGA